MGGSSGNIEAHTYFYYKVYLPSKGIIRSQPIYVYNSTGTLIYTISPNDARMDYENGVYEVPGSERNEIIETISTASFWINYSTSKLQIDYNNVLFKIDKSLIPNTNYANVTADFEYATALMPIDDGRNIFDGRWDTQAQVVFYAKPPTGYAFARVDLGQSYEIQAIDIIHGFFKPNETDTDTRSFDINNKYSLQYSTDDTNYYPVCKEATNFNLSGGASVSFEQDKLGDDFEARYFKLIINDMNKVDWKNGVWVASFVEFACYRNVILKGESLLTPTTFLDGNYAGSALSGAGATVNLTVNDTSAFDTYGTAYLDETAFTYGGTNSTQFLYCSGAGIFSAKSNDTRIAAEVESNTRKYDDDSLLTKLGDKIYKDKELNSFLSTQARIEKRAGDYLSEFLKQHTRASISLAYSPHIRVAQTVLVIDEINHVSQRYFVESLKGSNRGVEITIAYYQ